MKDKLFEEMAYNILEDYTRAYSAVDKDTLARYLRTKFEEYSVGDRVEVVRCKDCEFYVSECCRHDLALNLSRDDDFCSYGERKEK